MYVLFQLESTQNILHSLILAYLAIIIPSIKLISFSQIVSVYNAVSENPAFLFEIVRSYVSIQCIVGNLLISTVKFVLVPQMLAMMVDLEEDEDWANSDELEDDDFDR